jgi:hypothetical protein
MLLSCVVMGAPDLLVNRVFWLIADSAAGLIGTKRVQPVLV